MIVGKVEERMMIVRIARRWKKRRRRELISDDNAGPNAKFKFFLTALCGGEDYEAQQGNCDALPGHDAEMCSFFHVIQLTVPKWADLTKMPVVCLSKRRRIRKEPPLFVQSWRFTETTKVLELTLSILGFEFPRTRNPLFSLLSPFRF